MKWPLNQHWFCVVMLLPAAVMIWIHEAFGISNEMGGHLVGQREATDAEVLYNYAMAGAFFAGVAAFIVHSFMLASRSDTWLILKLIGLAVAWYALLSFAFR